MAWHISSEISCTVLSQAGDWRIWCLIQFMFIAQIYWMYFEKDFLKSNTSVHLCVLVWFQDNSAMENVPAVPSWRALHQLRVGGHGSEIHHRSHLQWLHLRLWVWHFYSSFPGNPEPLTSHNPTSFAFLSISQHYKHALDLLISS